MVSFPSLNYETYFSQYRKGSCNNETVSFVAAEKRNKYFPALKGRPRA